MTKMISDYDKVRYEGTIVPNAHPGHLVCCANWSDIRHSPPQNIHLAELGCGDGANLLPLAFYQPDSTFVGIDNAESELNRALYAVVQIGLQNIQFVHTDVCNLRSNDFVPCDYIIVHGLFSWVSDETREAIFKFCQNSLSPSGLAYISYNAQPGWAARRLVRETLMRSRSVQEARTENKAKIAIEVAAQMLADLPSRDYAHAVLLAEELERVRNGKPFYVFHEYLAEFNEGFWLRDFVECARQFGLDYVGDAQFCRWEGQIPKELRNSLSRRDLDRVEQEEAADLLCNRYFHESILCRDDTPRGNVSHQDILEQVHIATALRAQSNPFDLSDGILEQFIGNHGQEVTLDGAITKAAVVLLAAQWPAGMTLEALYQRAKSFLVQYKCDVTSTARSQLIQELITLFEAGVVDLRLKEPVINITSGDYPKIHALARYEIMHRDALTTPFHLPLALDYQSIEMASAMDGSKSREQLAGMFERGLVEETIALLGRWGLLE